MKNNWLQGKQSIQPLAELPLLGRTEIDKILAKWKVPPVPARFDWSLRTEERITKRVGKWARTNGLPGSHQIDIGNLVGNVVSTYDRFPLSDNNYTAEVVDKLDWNAGDYGDHSSCFWTTKRYARKLLERNDGGAILIRHRNQGIGRVLFVEKNFPVLFNAYGDLFHQLTLEAAAVLAARLHVDQPGHLIPVALRNMDEYTGIIHINQSRGILLSSIPLSHTLKVDMGIDTSSGVYCRLCDTYEDAENMIGWGECDRICKECIQKSLVLCGICGEPLLLFSAVRDVRGVDPMCQDCFAKFYHRCRSCYSYIKNGDKCRCRAMEEYIINTTATVASNTLDIYPLRWSNTANTNVIGPTIIHRYGISRMLGEDERIANEPQDE